VAKKKPATTAPEPPAEPDLTPQQQAFLAEYLLTGKQVHAYRHAFPGTSYCVAKTNANRLLKNANVRREVSAAQTDAKRQFRVRFRQLLDKFAQLAFSDIGDVVDLTDPDRPRLKPRAEIPPEARKAIKSIAMTPHGVKVTMHDQAQALRVLAAHLGLTQEITPLESLLAGLPPELAAQVRVALAGAVRPGGGATGP
jgi:phage terminase small subunit